MSKNRRVLAYISGAVSLLSIVILAVWLFSAWDYKKQIPELPDFQNLPVTLREQISQADKKAHRNPAASNLGYLGMVYHSSMFYDKAALCYNLAVKRNSGNWIWSYYLGLLNQEMGDPRSAIRDYMEVLNADPEIFLAQYYLAACYQKIGLADSSELALKSIISHMDKNLIVKSSKRYDYFPLVTYAMYDLARLYMSKGRTDEAEKSLLNIINYQRAFGPAYRLLGNIYSIRGDEKLSSKYIVRSNDLTVNPSPVDTISDKLSLLSRSDVYLLKKIDEAEKNVFPEYALKLVNHSLTCFPENNYLVAKAIKLFIMRDSGKRALPYLDENINFFRNDYNELKSVGDLLYTKGFYSQALNYYSNAVKIKPQDSQVQSCIVICLLKEGRREEALNKVIETLNGNSTNPVALADGVTLLFSLGERDKARIWLSKLRKISPSFPKGYQLEGMMAEQDSNCQKAIENYNTAFKDDPSDMTTVRLLGNLLLKQKLWEKAISHFNTALEHNPNEPYILEKLGTLLVTCSAPEFRDVINGRDLCERAFIHTMSHSVTLISAGRSLALAYAMLGDKRNATNVINMTINLAASENVPPAYLSELKNLSGEINKLK